MDLSIVIVNWNTKDLLDACLESVYATIETPSFDVWVVDNASSDSSVEMVQSKYPQAHLISNSCNRGFGRANNQGIAESTGDMVLLLNSDVVLTPDAVDRTWELMRKHGSIGALGCTLVWPDGGVQESWHDRLPYGPKLRKNRRPLRDGLREALLVWAAFLMVRRRVFDEVGGFDEDFLLFHEDTDWCWRVHEAGWTIAVNPEIKVIHGTRKSAGQLPKETYWQWLYTAEYMLYCKHHSAAEHALHMARRNLSYRARSLFHSLAFRAGGGQSHEEMARRLQVALGVIRKMSSTLCLQGGREQLDKLWTPCEKPE